MVGESLHQFDRELCGYALGNIRCHLGRPAFAAFVGEQLDAPVLAYLKALGGAEESQELLLNDAELNDLAETFSGGPHEFDRPWEPYEPLHRRSIRCVREIREHLGPPYAEDWARACARYAGHLESGRVRLHQGIEAVGAWVQELRRLLRAMGATDLLPRPEGAYPTPTALAPADADRPTSLEPASAGPQGEGNEAPIPDLAGILARLAAALEAQAASAGTAGRPAPEALSKEDAARFIGVDVATIEHLIRTRKLAYVQYGSQRGRVVPVASLRQFLEQNRQMTGDEMRRQRRPR